MKIKNTLKPLIAVTLLLSFNLCFAVPCLSPVTDGVSGSVSCENGQSGENNDSPHPDVVNGVLPHNNGVAIHGGGWTYLQKQDTDGGGLETGPNIDPNDVNLMVSPTNNQPNGNWSFSQTVWNMYDDVMVVLKTGNNSGIFFAAYLLDNVLQPTSGTWSTGNATSGGGKGLSHFTLYARGSGTTTNMPEPATLVLMLTILGGLFIRRQYALKRNF